MSTPGKSKLYPPFQQKSLSTKIVFAIAVVLEVPTRKVYLLLHIFTLITYSRYTVGVRLIFCHVLIYNAAETNKWYLYDNCFISFYLYHHFSRTMYDNIFLNILSKYLSIICKLLLVYQFSY